MLLCKETLALNHSEMIQGLGCFKVYHKEPHKGLSFTDLKFPNIFKNLLARYVMEKFSVVTFPESDLTSQKSFSAGVVEAFLVCLQWHPWMVLGPLFYEEVQSPHWLPWLGFQVVQRGTLFHLLLWKNLEWADTRTKISGKMGIHLVSHNMLSLCYLLSMFNFNLNSHR